MGMQRILIRTFLGLSILLIGCVHRQFTPITLDNIVVYPPPPDTARIQYLTSFSNSVDITGQRQGLARLILGEDKGKPIIKPYGLALHKGKIYICDTILGGLEIIDLNARTFDYFQPAGMGVLKKPVNCFVDKDGTLYVADTGRKQIVIFTPDLKYKGQIGDPSSMRLVDVFVSQDTIWACDMVGHTVRAFSRKTLKQIFRFPEQKPKTDPFLSSPTNLYVTKDRVYVSDFGAFKIKIFNKQGELLSTVGSYGKFLGQFVRPKGIAVDQDLRLFAVDAGFENVQIFDKNGKLLMYFGGPYEKPGDMWLPAKVVIDYEHVPYFEKYAYSGFRLKYLIFVTNQYGPDKISVYGFIESKGTE